MADTSFPQRSTFPLVYFPPNSYIRSFGICSLKTWYDGVACMSESVFFAPNIIGGLSPVIFTDLSDRRSSRGEVLAFYPNPNLVKHGIVRGFSYFRCPISIDDHQRKILMNLRDSIQVFTSHSFQFASDFNP